MKSQIKKFHWAGPFPLEALLKDAISGKLPKPPVSRSAYLVTSNAWIGAPNILANDEILWVGGTINPNRFRTRVGDVVADIFGFYDESTREGHSWGGRKLHQWCIQKGKSPLELHVAWLDRVKCHRCAEIELYEWLRPVLNKNRPTRCDDHG